VVIERSGGGRLDAEAASDTEVALQWVRDSMLEKRYEVACIRRSDAGSHMRGRLSWSRTSMGERVEVAAEVAV